MNHARELVPLRAADVSAFCKNLRQQLLAAPALPPGHLALLNMLARSSGYRNYQALRAAAGSAAPDEHAPSAPARPAPTPIKRASPGTLTRTAWRALGHFDTDGRLIRWPTQFAVQQLALWGLWLRLPAQRTLTEADVNRYVNAFHTFGDMATLRRELVNAKLVWRERDCSAYRKLAPATDEETRAFLDALLAACRAGGEDASGPGKPARPAERSRALTR
jgi:hypothetical protein